MTITTAVCNQFKADILAMNVHAAGNTYKLALIKSSASRSYDATQSNAGPSAGFGTGTPSASLLGTDAVAASGTYGVTGFTLNAPSATLQSSTTGCLDFGAAPSAATGTTISADGAIIYNATETNGKSLAVYAFAGNPIVSVGGSFTITFPSVAAATSLIRIA